MLKNLLETVPNNGGALPLFSEKLDPKKFKDAIEVNKRSVYMKRHKNASFLPVD